MFVYSGHRQPRSRRRRRQRVVILLPWTGLVSLASWPAGLGTNKWLIAMIFMARMVAWWIDCRHRRLLFFRIKVGKECHNSTPSWPKTSAIEIRFRDKPGMKTYEVQGSHILLVASTWSSNAINPKTWWMTRGVIRLYTFCCHPSALVFLHA